MSNIKAIFYDFDGVIKDSTEVKTLAFYNLYLPFGKEIAEKVIAHHKKHGGVSRFEKFKIYHKELLGEDLSKEQIEHWATKFSKLVLKEVIKSPFVKGAKESIEAIKRDNIIKQFIVTGTPQLEIEFIIKELKLSDNFIELCGSPTNKIDWSQSLINKYGYSPNEVLFIGDALTDYDAAKFHDFQFLLRSHQENRDYFNDIEVFEVENLVGLVDYIKNI